MKIADILTESVNYEEGDCPIFAIALHKLSGLPLMALVEYDEESQSEVLIHAYVRQDARWCIDSSGAVDIPWMLEKYPNNGDAYEVPLTEKELLKLGYGNNMAACPTLQQVLPDAKQVLADEGIM